MLQGWGITKDPSKPNIAIMSDSSDILTYCDIEQDFKVVSRKPVRRQGIRVSRVNELEFVDGYIYANQFLEKIILKIDPSTAQVIKTFDLTALYNQYNKEHFRNTKKMLNQN